MIRSRRQKIGAQISLIGSFCLAGFIFAQLAILVPPRILDAQWQFAISNGLVNQALLAVFGFSLICSAPAIAGSEENENLYSRRDLISRLAIIPAIGYLLLIPVFAFNLARGIDAGIQLEKKQQQISASQISQVRSVIQKAKTTAALQESLRSLGAPTLPDIYMQRSIDSIRETLLSRLEATQAEVNNRPRMNASSLWPALRDLLRFSLLSISFSLVFSTSAILPGGQMPLIDGVLMLCNKLRARAVDAIQKVNPKRRNSPDSEYFEGLIDEPRFDQSKSSNITGKNDK